MSKNEITDLTAQQNLPVKIEAAIDNYFNAEEGLESIKAAEAKIKARKTELQEVIDNSEKILLTYHQDHGDFEVGEITVKKSTSWKTVVVNKDKIPASCLTKKTTTEISLTKVKELILEGKLPREVAYQQKNESIKLK